MKTLYDDFNKLKLKDMSKSISDMTYKYINPDTQTPTKVPAIHYEKILDEVAESYLSTATSRQFLNIMYNQLLALNKEDQKYFTQALICIDLGINPKDLRINEQIALEYIYEYICDKKETEKKNFHLLGEDIVISYKNALEDPELQTCAIETSNYYENKDGIKDNDLNIKGNKYGDIRVINTCSRKNQSIALLQRDKNEGSEYIIAFNYEISENKLNWGYGYYYENDARKAFSDFDIVKEGGNLANTFKENRDSKKHHYRNER